MRKAITIVVVIAAWFVAGAPPATAAAEPTWSGPYSLKRFAATKYGSSGYQGKRVPKVWAPAHSVA